MARNRLLIRRPEHPNYRSAILSNTYRIAVPWIRSIGFRPPTLLSRAQGAMSGIAEDFLANTRLTRNDAENEAAIASYLDDRGAMMLSLIGHEAAEGRREVVLPKSIPLTLNLEESIFTRNSVRTYTGDSIELSYLATIIRAGFAVTREAEIQCLGGGTVTAHFRTVASAGGLYPIDAYMGVNRVKGLKPGIYQYRPLRDTLVQTGGEEELSALWRAFAAPEEVISKSESNVFLLLVAQPWRSMRKYGARGLRFVFHETGAISQNIHLAVNALGLGSVDCASLYDDEIHTALKIDGLYRTLTHSIVIGVKG